MSLSQRRIVITGMGALSPLGLDVKTSWEGLAAGKSGVGRIAAFDTTNYKCKIAGEVRGFEPKSAFKNPKDASRADRYTQLAMAASKEAFANSCLSQCKDLDLDRCGVIVGSGIGGLKSLADQDARLIASGPDRISPFMIPMMISNMASGTISIEFGFRGPNFAVVTACATAAQCIGEAARLIRDDDADVCLAGGSEAACVELGIGGFAAMRALSTRNDEPEKASRPFDMGRDGFVLGEGAAIVVVEELEHARRRGATIYAELTGYGITADAFHMTSPSGEGAERAMRYAMRRAGIGPDDIDYINAHGTSTAQGDACEAKAIRTVFGEAAKKVAVSSTKSMTGHLLGAAGSFELIACVKAIETGVIPPTINLDNPDPDCELNHVANIALQRPVRRALSNSFGFGGHNACIIVESLRD
ncbi:beta-ketoacyl-[acyl-carrier-protein] synthase II [Verrucomicrobia bacterium LW23]|nr:beta-ketoacyl-[acyl-carrier-protein] synthase II [Verrucomicrobia bacterium LW23]